MKCCDLTSGMLRNKITIERLSKTKDAIGGYTSSWVTLGQPFAYIKPVSGTERLQAMKLEANITHKIYVRWFADLRADDRIIFKGREMQIRVIIDLEERNKWYELTCEEGRVN